MSDSKQPWEGHDFMPDTRKLEGWVILQLGFQVQGPRLLEGTLDMSRGVVGQGWRKGS